MTNLRDVPYPGGDHTPQPSRFDADGKCAFCDHGRDEHGEKKCGVNKVASIFCRCPFGKGDR